jgi:hypothetical protein
MGEINTIAAIAFKDDQSCDDPYISGFRHLPSYVEGWVYGEERSYIEDL